MADRDADQPAEDWMDAMRSQEAEAAEPMDSDADSYQSLDTDEQDELMEYEHRGAVLLDAAAASTNATRFLTVQRQISGNDRRSRQGRHLEGSEHDIQTGAMTFDPSLATSHAYLGDFDDLEGEVPPLDPGQRCKLPLLALEGVVLMPGATLPLRLFRRSDLQRAEAALRAPAPFTRLMAVVCARPSRFAFELQICCVGCTAELCQISRGTDGSLNLLARGRQRMVLDVEGRSIHSDNIQQTIICDDQPIRVPREVHMRLTTWPSWVWQQRDAFHCAKQAASQFASMAPQAKQYQGDPLLLSYWLASNLPLEVDTRQRLLEARTVAERLRQEIALMQKLGELQCIVCGTVVADSKNMLSMSDEGTGGTFVNTHGYVHDTVTLLAVCEDAVRLEGEPETERSWFPGYAWTIAYCAGCGQHLGWRFTDTRTELVPSQFWGIRRPAMTEVQDHVEDSRGRIISLPRRGILV